MERSFVTLEEFFRLLPPLEELEDLQLSAIGAAVPDPAKEWEGSRSYATIDKRVLSQEALERAIAEAETAFRNRMEGAFAVFRPMVQAFWSGEDGVAAGYLVRLGEQQEELGRYRAARQCFEAALSLSLPLADKKPQVLALRRIGRVAVSLGNVAEALQYYQRSADLAEASGDEKGEIIALTGSGNVLALQGRWAEAETTYRNALNRIESAACREEFELQRAQLYNNLALTTTRQGHLTEAASWFSSALEIWGVVSSPYDLAVCYHSNGLFYGVQGEGESARTMFQRALDLPIPSGARAGIAIDLAESFLRDGHIALAEEWGREAEEHAIAARSPYFLGRMYHGLGNIARGRMDANGITFFEKALEIARANELPLLEGETLTDYAILRNQIGGPEEALSYLERAREIFGQLGAIHELARVQEVSTAISGGAAPQVAV